MPDNNLYRPITGQATDGTFYNYPAQKSNALAANAPISIPVQASYPGQVGNQGSTIGQLQANNPAIVRVPALSNSPALAGSSTETCTTCTSSTVVKGRRLQRLSLSERLPGRHEFSKPDSARRILSQELQSRLSKTVYMQVQ